MFIAGFVALQFLVPLSYLGRNDASDDRFTWRSFTAPEAPQCESYASVRRFDGAETSVPLGSLIHRDWVRYVQRGRRAVVDAFLAHQCQAEGVERVEVFNRCTEPDATRSFLLRCGGERALETTRTAAR